MIPVYTADVSGVCSALYELGGMTVMHDPSDATLLTIRMMKSAGTIRTVLFLFPGSARIGRDYGK